MKKLIFFILSILFTTSAFSQNFLGMKVMKYGLTATIDQDRVKNLNAQYFLNLAETPIELDMENLDFSSRNLVSMTCDNPALKATMTVLPFSKHPNLQLDLGANFMFNRIDATRYSISNIFEEIPEHNFSLRSYSHEVALDASLLYNKKLGFFNLYGGVGTNLGMTFAGNMEISGTMYYDSIIPIPLPIPGPGPIYNEISINEEFEIKNVLHQRAFVQGGISILILKRIELGVEGRAGVGYRLNQGNGARGTQLLSGGLTAKWNLR